MSIINLADEKENEKELTKRLNMGWLLGVLS